MVKVLFISELGPKVIIRQGNMSVLPCAKAKVVLSVST
jgi:hypothetical protein